MVTESLCMLIRFLTFDLVLDLECELTAKKERKKSDINKV